MLYLRYAYFEWFLNSLYWIFFVDFCEWGYGPGGAHDFEESFSWTSWQNWAVDRAEEATHNRCRTGGQSFDYIHGWAYIRTGCSSCSNCHAYCPKYCGYGEDCGLHYTSAKHRRLWGFWWGLQWSSISIIFATFAWDNLSCEDRCQCWTLKFLSSLTMQSFSLFLIPLSRPSLSLFWVLSPGNCCWLVRTRIVLGFTVVVIWEPDFVALLVKFLCSLKIDIHAMQLLLMKRGGEMIYAGLLGLRSKYLVDYFQVQYFTSSIRTCCFVFNNGPHNIIFWRINAYILLLNL